MYAALAMPSDDSELVVGQGQKRSAIKASLKSMRKLSDLIRDIFATEIPGYPDIPTLQWGERYGKGVVSHSVIQAWINQKRIPSLEMLVWFGVLLKESGAEVGVFDPLLAAADGLYHDFVEQMEGQVEDVPLGDYSALSNPEPAPLALPVETTVKTYQAQSFADRKAAMQPILEAIARDLSYSQMSSEYEVVRAVVNEAVVICGNHPERLAETADVPSEWVRLIVSGRLEDAQKISDPIMVIKLADKVPDLDGRKGTAEFFACLLSDSELKAFRKEIRRRAKIKN